jgi:AcrR family transcriptional regulator
MTQAPTGARRGRPGHDREAVLGAAVALFNQQGYDATSIGDVADALGVTKSAVYHHVASKEELLAGALDEALEHLESAVNVAGRLEHSAVDRLRAVVRQSVEVLVAHQPAVTLLLRVRGNTATEVAALERRRQIDRRFAGLVRAAVENGALRDDLDPEAVSRLLFGMVNSLTEWYRSGGSMSGPQLADTIVQLAFEGLLIHSG